MDSETEWPTQSSDYTLLQKISSSQKNAVWLAECHPRNEECAVKIIDLEDIAEAHMQAIRKEIQIMNMCKKHPNVVDYYCSFVDGDKLWLVMKLLEGSSLDIMKFSHPNGFEDETLIATILQYALKGLEFLHESNLLYREGRKRSIVGFWSICCIRVTR